MPLDFRRTLSYSVGLVGGMPGGGENCGGERKGGEEKGDGSFDLLDKVQVVMQEIRWPKRWTV